jgi:hypothetical protein
VDEIPDDVAIEYGKLCEGDDLCMEETSQMRQRIGFSDTYSTALDFVNPSSASKRPADLEIPNVIPNALQQAVQDGFFLLHVKSAVSSLSDQSHSVH